MYDIVADGRDVVAILKKKATRRQPTALDRIRAILRRRNYHDWKKVSAIEQVLKKEDGK